MTFVTSSPSESVPAAVRAHAGEEVGCEGDEALLRELVGDAAHPVGQAEDLVDDDDDPRLLLLLGVDDPRHELPAVGELDVDPLPVPRRLREGLLRLVGVGRDRLAPASRPGRREADATRRSAAPFVIPFSWFRTSFRKPMDHPQGPLFAPPFTTTVNGSASASTSGTTARNRFPSGETSKAIQLDPFFCSKRSDGVPDLKRRRRPHRDGEEPAVARLDEDLLPVAAPADDPRPGRRDAGRFSRPRERRDIGLGPARFVGAEGDEIAGWRERRASLVERRRKERRGLSPGRERSSVMRFQLPRCGPLGEDERPTVPRDVLRHLEADGRRERLVLPGSRGRGERGSAGFRDVAEWMMPFPSGSQSGPELARQRVRRDPRLDPAFDVDRPDVVRLRPGSPRSNSTLRPSGETATPRYVPPAPIVPVSRPDRSNQTRRLASRPDW